MAMTHLPSLHAPPFPQRAVLPSLRASPHVRQSPHRHDHYRLHSPMRPYLQPTHQTPGPSSVATPVNLALTGPLRRGKWTRAEEEYAAATISYFCDGVLAIQYGTTLRGYLAQQLHCDPMRISKKLLPGSVFAGIKINPKIGRRAYYPCARDSQAAAYSIETAAYRLARLRHAFLQSLDDEDHVVDVDGAPRHGALTPQSPLRALSDRKRSYDDITSVLCAPPHGVKDAGPIQPTLVTFKYTAPSTTPTRFHHAAFSPVVCKLPKLTLSDDVASRASYSPPPRSGSPVTVAASTAVLPPLRVSLVRASMC